MTVKFGYSKRKVKSAEGAFMFVFGSVKDFCYNCIHLYQINKITRKGNTPFKCRYYKKYSKCHWNRDLQACGFFEKRDGDIDIVNPEPLSFVLVSKGKVLIKELL